MPSPQDGTKTTLVPPTDPTAALDADDAQPGEVETIKAQQRQTGTGKYGSTPVSPYVPPETPEQKKEKPSWIEIKLHDKNNKPVPGEHYRVTMPDNSVKDGTLDANGFARVDGIPDGKCVVTFPDRGTNSWGAA